MSKSSAGSTYQPLRPPLMTLSGTSQTLSIGSNLSEDRSVCKGEDKVQMIFQEQETQEIVGRWRNKESSHITVVCQGAAAVLSNAFRAPIP
jgi:hypothetical protein